MSKDIMAAISVMAYGYHVNVLINEIDVGIKGGKSESLRLFSKEHSMLSDLPENMKKLACLQPGDNEIKIEYKRIIGETSTGMTVELRSEEQFDNDEFLVNYRTEPDDTNGAANVIEKFIL